MGRRWIVTMMLMLWSVESGSDAVFLGFYLGLQWGVFCCLSIQCRLSGFIIFRCLKYFNVVIKTISVDVIVAVVR